MTRTAPQQFGPMIALRPVDEVAARIGVVLTAYADPGWPTRRVLGDDEVRSLAAMYDIPADELARIVHVVHTARQRAVTRETT